MPFLRVPIKAILSRVANPDPHYFAKPDLDPPQSEKSDPDPLQTSGAVEVHGEPWTLTMEAWRVKTEP